MEIKLKGAIMVELILPLTYGIGMITIYVIFGKNTAVSLKKDLNDIMKA